MVNSVGQKKIVARHGALDDIQGLSIGVLLSAYGVNVLASLGLVTGQTAGLALLVAHVTGFGFGWVFFAINIPFYLIAYRTLGGQFFLRSLIAIAALSIIVEVLGGFGLHQSTHPALGVVVFGLTVGLGLLALFRHGASLGGLGVMALLAQERFGIRAGYVQFVTDGLIFIAALFFFSASVVAYSFAGALILNLVITFNHRRDWYVAR